MGSVGVIEAEERGDVRVIQRGERLGFALEARDSVGVSPNASGDTVIATVRRSFVSRAVDLARD